LISFVKTCALPVQAVYINKKALKINRLTRPFVIPAGFGLLVFIGSIYFVNN
jgi:hypothetical protein